MFLISNGSIMAFRRLCGYSVMRLNPCLKFRQR
nr:MAG TPA: hypothetical protein [Caudoviricetes sp.]